MDYAKLAVRKDLTETSHAEEKDLLLYETKEAALIPGMKYAAIIYSEINVKGEKELAGKKLLMRSCQVLFFWETDKGKGNTACLYTSERGLPEELHSQQLLVNEMLRTWSGLRISYQPKKD